MLKLLEGGKEDQKREARKRIHEGKDAQLIVEEIVEVM